MKKNQQTGAVSIFIVIFTALLVSVITIGFVRTMMNDQQQASDDDLSQSAYDSAMAGVEDAKRVVALSMTGNTAATAALNNPACNAIATIAGGSLQESVIQTSSSSLNNDKDLQQAYTCVRVNMNTQTVVRDADADRSSIVPLRATGAFNRVEIRWASQNNLTGATEFDVASLNVDQPLRAQASYPTNRPSVLTAQFVRPSGSFTLESLDRDAASGAVQTLSFYPHSVTSEVSTPQTPSTLASSLDSRTQNSQQNVKCMRNPAAVANWGTYSCRAVITLSSTTPANSSTAFLRLVPRYTDTQISVSLFNNTTPVLFNGVQPSVDSTGRANDVFRRVTARIDGNAFPFPDAAVDIRGSLCKTFSVTNNTDDYTAGTCNPAP